MITFPTSPDDGDIHERWTWSGADSAWQLTAASASVGTGGGVSTFAALTDKASADIPALNPYVAPVASPTFTGTVTIPSGAAISGYLTSAAAALAYQPLASVLTGTTASFTTELASKLAGIEAGATADQDLSGYVPTSRTVAGHALSENVTLVSADISDASSVGEANKLVKYSGTGSVVFSSVGAGTVSFGTLEGTDDTTAFNWYINANGLITATRNYYPPNESGTLALTASTTGIPDKLHNATISGTVTFGTGGKAAMLAALEIAPLIEADVITGTSTTPGLPTPAQLKLAAETHGGGGGGSGTTVVTLAADTAARVSTTTFANMDISPGFVLPTLEANKPYRFEWSILSTAGAGGVKMQIQLPTSANTNAITTGWYGASGSISPVVTTGTTPRYFVPGGKAGAATAFCQSGSAIIRTGATGGVPELQWAQIASDASDSKLLANSMVAITPF